MKGKGTLSVQMIEQSKQVEILISDTGSGMKKEIVSKIFNPGLNIIKIPIKPIIIANHLLQPNFSFNMITDNIATIKVT